MQKVIFFLFLWIAGTLNPLSGQIKLIGEPENNSYPEISFKINSRDPEKKPESHFRLEEAENNIKFEVEAFDPSDSGSSKSVLVLWEYLSYPSRSAQNDFFRELLLSNLEKMVNEGDEINVATFAWSDQMGGKKILKFLNPEFTESPGDLIDPVKSAAAPGGKGVQENHGSELHMAISEGIETLAPKSGRARVLVVLSAEFNNPFNTGVDISMVTAKARHADVSVYNFRYKIKTYKYNIDDLATATYGLSYTVDQTNPAAAGKAIRENLEVSVRRSLGIDYEFSFQTAAGRDGKSHQVQLSAAQESLNISFNSPSLGVGGWIGENPILAVLLIVLILGLAVGILFLIKIRRRKAEEERVQQLSRIQEMEDQGKSAESRIHQQQEELRKIRAEEERKKQAQEAERLRIEGEAEAEELLKAMYANGKNPRVSFKVKGEPVTISLPSPVTSFGRESTNDIQIDHPTISRAQFQIVYLGGRYSVRDLASTNGTFLNEVRISEAEVRHGDVLRAGEVSFNFYI